MTSFQLLGYILLIILIACAIGAIWLTSILISESYEIKKAVKDVQCAFGNIEIEINKRLQVHNALHYSELLKIIKFVGDMIPGVELRIDREFQSGRVHILVESGDIKSKLTFVGTIIEYGIPRVSETA